MIETECEAQAVRKYVTYRLPTEAEWEYAARAGATGDFTGDLGAIAWFNENSGKQLHPVGQKLPNAWGLYDMLGNVTEWVVDGFDKYPVGPVTDPVGRPRRSPIYRGGSFISSPKDVRFTNRTYNPPTTGTYFVGFAMHGLRIVREN